VPALSQYQQWSCGASEAIGCLDAVTAAGAWVIERTAEFRCRDNLFQILLIGDVAAERDDGPVVATDTEPGVDRDISISLRQRRVALVEAE